MIIIIFISIIQATENNSNSPNNSSENIEFNDISEMSQYYFNGSFFWPVPGYHRITSPFGPRRSPTTGSSTNHSGIDIAAPEGTVIYSVISGIVSFVGFKGAGGCTITIVANKISVSYCHVSPNYIVSVGQFINVGQQVGNVGPKVIYGIPNNPYKDSNRQSDQWCNNWLPPSFDNS